MYMVLSFVWRYFLISIWIFSLQRCHAAHDAGDQANAQVACFDHSKIYWKLHGDRDCAYERTTSKNSPNKIHKNRQPAMVTHRFLSVSMKDTKGDVHCLYFEFDMKESFRNSITVALISGTERGSTTLWETSWTTGTRGFAWIPIQSSDCFQVELKVDHQAADDESIYIKNVVYHKSACKSHSKTDYSISPALFTQKTTDLPTQAGINRCKEPSTEERFMSVTGTKSKPLLSRIKRSGSTSYSDVSSTKSPAYTTDILAAHSTQSSIDIASDTFSSAAHNASYSPSTTTYITTDSLSSSTDITSDSQSSTQDFTLVSPSKTTSDSPSTDNTTSDSPSSTTDTTSYSPSSTNNVTSDSPSSTNDITSDSSTTNDIPSDYPSSTNYITSTLPSSTKLTTSDTSSPGAPISSSSVTHTSVYSPHLGPEMKTHSSSLTTDSHNTTFARAITNVSTFVENSTETDRSLTTSFGSLNGHSTSSTSIIVGSVAAGTVVAVLGLVLILRWKQCHYIKRTGNEMNCGHSFATSMSMTTDGDAENAEAEISDQTDMHESPYITFHNYEEVKPLSEICAPSTSLTTENASIYAAVVKQSKGIENLITQNSRTVDFVASNISENSSYPHHSATSSGDEYMRIDFQASSAVQPQSDLYDHVTISNPFPPSSVSDGRSNQQQHPATSPGDEYMRTDLQASNAVQIHSNLYDHVETRVRYPQEQKEPGLYFILEE